MNPIPNEILCNLLAVLWETGTYEKLEPRTRQWILNNGTEIVLNNIAGKSIRPGTPTSS